MTNGAPVRAITLEPSEDIQMKTVVRFAALAALSAVAPSLALAHATLEVQKASPGAPYKAVMRIPHGCGALATLKVRIRIPDGFVGVKPMPKAGWKLETTKGKYDHEYEVLHARLTEGVKEISWTGELPNDWYDEFVFTGTVAGDVQPGTTLWFPTVQECDGAADRWIEIPTQGKAAHDLKSPAPGLQIVPKP
jgi:periplasmic copper chaperone A